MVPFTRKLGARSGVQLNPLKDDTERFVADNSDQVFAAVGRFTRGRIDRAFLVTADQLFRQLGRPASTLISQLNETLVQIYETMRRGAYAAVVYRLTPATATNDYMIAKLPAESEPLWSVSPTVTAGYLIAVKHLECFNDGVRIALHAREVLDDTETPVDSTEVVLRLVDVQSGQTLYEFEGSLDPLAQDEFGNSTYLPSVVSSLTDNVEVTVAADAAVPPTAAFYGVDTDGNDKFDSADLVYFDEDGTTYANTDYDRACKALKYSDQNFGYLLGAGTRAKPLISRLVALGEDINKQFVWSVPGDLTPAQAITFYNELGINSHYSQCYWAPLLADDPLNGGKAYIGTDGIQVGLRCARNAQTDANGLAPKNYPIAGKAYSVGRTSIKQTYTPDEIELDQLAVARINPVIYMRYNAGSDYVFVDSLTGAKTNGDKKLIAVAEMSSSVDDWIAQYAQEVLQLPMEESIKRMTDFQATLFPALQAAKWIKPSEDMGGRAYMSEVKANAMRPNDRLDTNYRLRYDGTTRAIYAQQTLSK